MLNLVFGALPFCAVLVTNLHIELRASRQLIRKRNSLIHLILDPSWYRSDIGSDTKGFPNILTEETANKLEKLGRVFCYKIYKRRFSILSEEEEGSDDETEVDSNYSLHDTTEASDTDDSTNSIK